MLSVLCPIGLSSNPRSSVDPRAVYSFVKPTQNRAEYHKNLGGVVSKIDHYSSLRNFDGFRFYSGLMLLDHKSISSIQELSISSRFLKKNQPYSKLINYLVGVLGLKKNSKYSLITARGRFVLNSMYFYFRKNTDSFW